VATEASDTNRGAPMIFITAMLASTAHAVDPTPSQTIEGAEGTSYFGLGVDIVGDVNGDGYGDVLIGGWYAAELYLGGPDGPDLVPHRTFEAVGTIAVRLDGGDANGDGFADVAFRVENDTSNTYDVEVRYGGPDGLPQAADATFPGAENVLWHDIDGDGFDELVLAYPDVDVGGGHTGLVEVYAGTAGGVAATPMATLEAAIAGNTFGKKLAAGDINGDGFGDLVISEGLDEYFFAGALAGFAAPVRLPNRPLVVTFATERRGVAVADLDADGFDDVVFWEGLVYRGSSAGPVPASTVWGPPTFARYRYVDMANVGDVDGDGFDEVAFAGTTNGRLISAGPGSVGPVTPLRDNTSQNGMFWGIAGGDVNGDGYADVLWGSPYATWHHDGAAALALGGPTGLDSANPIRWQPRHDHDLGTNVISLGDINGDGYEDVGTVGGELVVEDVVTVFLGSASGLDPEPAATWPGSEVVAAGDVNGDGLSDAVVVVATDSWSGEDIGPLRVAVHLGDPAGPATAPTRRLAQPTDLVASDLIAIGDADGDGFDDVAVMSSRRNLLYRGGPSGPSPSPDLISAPDDIFPRVWADLDGDGFDDLVLTEDLATETVVYVAAGSPAGISAPVEVDRVANDGGNVGVIATGDWNDDGYADLSFSGDVALQVTFGSATGFDPTSTVELLDCPALGFNANSGDLDGDGIDDLFVGGCRFAGDPVAFGTAPAEMIGVTTYAVADVDGDGAIEILSFNSSGWGTLKVHER